MNGGAGTFIKAATLQHGLRKRKNKSFVISRYYAHNGRSRDTFRSTKNTDWISVHGIVKASFSLPVYRLAASFHWVCRKRKHLAAKLRAMIERSFFPKLCRNTTKLSRDAKLNAWPQFSSIHTLNPRFHVWTLQVEEMGRYLNLKRNLFWKARRISYLLFFWVIL